jgi:hypothetical protein
VDRAGYAIDATKFTQEHHRNLGSLVLETDEKKTYIGTESKLI